ncbi:MAG: sensor histidine kinase [Vicinamibacterales bacterium]
MAREGGAAAPAYDPALLDALIDHRDAILVEAINGTPILSNSAFLRLFGAADRTRIPAEPSPDAARTAELRAARQRATERVGLADGRIIEREYVPVFDGSALVAHMWRYVDVSERVRAEDAWRLSTVTLRQLAANAEAAREGERRKLAAVLHDELGQRFTTIRLELMAAVAEFQRTALPEQFRIVDRLQAAAGLIDVGIATVRKLSSELRPPLLDHLGIVAAVRWEASTFERRTGVRCRVSAFPADIQLDDERRTAIYRILLEALTNVARHAHAGAVRIALLRRSGVLLVKIEDNGRGIPTGNTDPTRALGLLGMQERARAFDGDVRVVNARRGGTRVLATFPL